MSSMPYDDDSANSQSNAQKQFSFIRADEQSSQPLDWVDGPELVRKSLSEALGARNVAFLLGAGCSSLVLDDKVERGIATMGPLAKEFCTASNASDENENEVGHWAFNAKELALLAGHGLSLDGEYGRNLERLMETLFALRFVLSRSDDQGDEEDDQIGRGKDGSQGLLLP